MPLPSSRKTEQNLRRILGNKVDLERLSRAIQTQFASDKSTSNSKCLSIALITAKFLQSRGVEQASIEIGETAWRVDAQSDSATVIHGVKRNPAADTIVMPHSTGGATMFFHAWNIIGPIKVDFTTYQLPEKVRILDAADGQSTPCTWKPDFLVFSQNQSKSFVDVIQAYETCFSYNPDNSVIPGYVGAESALREVSEEELAVFSAIYNAA